MEEFVTKSYKDNDWIGVVVENNDPTFSGRARVRVFGIFNELEPELLPWASPINSAIFSGGGAGSLSVPKIGQFVRIQFNNGDIYAPEYTTIQNIDSELINRIKEDYIGTHVILYDSEKELNVIYQELSGFMIFFKESFIQITPDRMISLQHADSDSLIQLEGDVIRIVSKNEIEISAAAKVTVTGDEVEIDGKQTTKVGTGPQTFHAVLAEPLWAILRSMAIALDGKIPLSPGVNVGILESQKQAATSNNVILSK